MQRRDHPALYRLAAPSPASLIRLFLFAFCPLISLAQKQPQANKVPSTQALYQTSLDLIHAGRLAEAQRVLLQAQAQSPDEIPIEIALGKLDSLLGRNADAVQLFRDIETRLPQDNENQINLAIALAAQGSLKEALPHATTATQNQPGSAAAHHIRGKVLEGIGHTDEAFTEYDAALHIAPSDPLTLYDEAVLCESSSRFLQEVQLLRRLIAIQPQRAQLHFLVGRALSRSGDEAAARLEFREAVRLDPSHRAALYNLARALMHDDPAESARLTARFRALRLTEDELNTLRDQGNRGVTAMQSRDWPLAITLFQSALTTCAGCSLEGTLEKDLGLAQCQSGDTVAGAASLHRALLIDPKDLEILQAIEIAETANAAARR